MVLNARDAVMDLGDDKAEIILLLASMPSVRTKKGKKGGKEKSSDSMPIVLKHGCGLAAQTDITRITSDGEIYTERESSIARLRIDRSSDS